MEQHYAHALGILAARAHDLLLEVGHPLPADALIEHVFGKVAPRTPKAAHGAADFWRGQLARVLTDASIFAAHADGTWGLAAWGAAEIALDDMEYVVVDTETTGLDPTTQRVLEVAAIRCRGAVVLERFSTLVDPQRPVPPLIRQLTGITADVLRDAVPPERAFAAFVDFAGSSVLVGHNMRFDLNFLAAEVQRHLRGHLRNTALCTIRLSRHLLPELKRVNLDNLARALDLPVTGRHRAMADAELTRQAFWLLVERARERGITTQGRLLTVSGLAGHGAPHSEGRRSEGRTLLDPALRKGVSDRPGVYLMRDAQGEVIYVGKAKNLKKRIASYYSQPSGYRRRKEGLLESVRELETRVVGSELEALILESRLIKTYLPRFNVQQRYYEEYSFIKVDVASPFPRVSATRAVAPDGGRYFGPFRSKRVVDTVIDLVQRLFPIRTCTRKISPDGQHRGRAASPCFRFLVQRCLGPCHGGVSTAVYGEVIEQVLVFLAGGNTGMLGRVEEEMFKAARSHDFERASRLRDVLRQAERLLLSQQLLTGAVDQNNLVIVCPSAEEGAIELFGIRHGRLYDQRRFSVNHVTTLRESLAVFVQALGEAAAAPPVVGKEEIDAIVIIGRWVARFATSRQVVYLTERPVQETAALLVQAAEYVVGGHHEDVDALEWEDAEITSAPVATGGYVIGAPDPVDGGRLARGPEWAEGV